jgi:E3 ubiquitin-protein ligase TRIP12
VFLTDSKRSSPSLLARQLRLRLVTGDESDVPRNLHNIVVSIHAIATFQALHDYLRPRVAGLLSSGTRLSGMLAALAASGFSGSSSRDIADEVPPSTKTSAAKSSPTVVAPSASTSTISRRRSQRLSAKNAVAAAAPDTAAVDKIPAAATASDESAGMEIPVSYASVSHASGVTASALEVAPSDTVVDSELQADFTDDEVDAEVFDDEVDPDNSLSDKTVTLSVAEGIPLFFKPSI